MMWYLREATASQEIPLGPFLDSTNGNDTEEGLTIANTDIRLQKAGAAGAVAKNSGGATHDENGNYVTTLDADDTDTLGSMKVSVHESGALAVITHCVVLTGEVYDALILGTDTLSADVTQWKGATAPAMTGDAYAAVGGLNDFDPANDDVAAVTTVGSVTTKTGYALTAAYDDAKTAAQATVCTEARLAELAAANMPADLDAVNTKTTNLPLDPADESNAVTRAATTDALVNGLNDPTAATIATAVIDEVTYSESADPATATTLGDILSLMFAKMVNKLHVDGDDETIYKRDGTTPIVTHVLTGDDDQTNRSAGT